MEVPDDVQRDLPEVVDAHPEYDDLEEFFEALLRYMVEMRDAEEAVSTALEANQAGDR